MLYANGCSFVWGDELEGCYDNPPTHQHLTFVSHIAKKLGIEYVNQGACGASNHKIFRDTILWLSSEESEKCTHVIIVWSAWRRDELPYDIPPERESQYRVPMYRSIIQYSDSRIEEIPYIEKTDKVILREFQNLNKKYYYRKFISQQLSYMIAIDQLCESRGIKLIMSNFHKYNWRDLVRAVKDKRKGGTIKEWVDLVGLMIGRLPKNCRIGLAVGEDMYDFCSKRDVLSPKGHPDEKGHVLYADYLLENFGFE